MDMGDSTSISAVVVVVVPLDDDANNEDDDDDDRGEESSSGGGVRSPPPRRVPHIVRVFDAVATTVRCDPLPMAWWRLRSW